MNEYIYLSTKFFSQPEIVLIESEFNGDKTLTIFIKLLFQAVKNQKDSFHYDEISSSDSSEKEKYELNFALQTLEKYALIERKSNEMRFINMQKWIKNQ